MKFHENEEDLKHETKACEILDGVEFKDGEAMAKAIVSLTAYIKEQNRPTGTIRGAKSAEEYLIEHGFTSDSLNWTEGPFSVLVDVLNEFSAHQHRDESKPQTGIEFPSDEEIVKISRKWAEDDKGHGSDKYFADCNYRNGMIDMRDLIKSRINGKPDNKE